MFIDGKLKTLEVVAALFFLGPVLKGFHHREKRQCINCYGFRMDVAGTTALVLSSLEAFYSTLIFHRRCIILLMRGGLNIETGEFSICQLAITRFTAAIGVDSAIKTT